MKSVAVGILAVFMIALVAACSGSGKNENAQIQEPTTDFPDTLRVATLYSPTSYFIYKEEKMGYDYGLVEKLVADKNVVLDLVVATNLASMIAMLDSGLVDLIAYEVPITSEYKDRVLHCGAENFTSQVLVQPKNSEDSRISDVTQLVGRDVYVEKDSKYQHRLENLNNELGGGINIHPIDKDTLITEDLIEMVSDGTIPLTIVDSDIARINKTYYKDLDITLELSFPQRSSWCVSPTKPWLADSINVWFEQESPRRVKATLLKRYFELSKNELSIYNLDLSRGVISVSYDPLFKKYAKTIDYDWRLLAAQGFSESRFDPNVVSWAGARGIMQIMPSTARAYGAAIDSIADPEVSIATAAKIISSLDRSLAKYVPDKEERLKFIVAAYNSGIAHIYDAIELARKHGKNPAIWYDNVETALLMKSNPEYYNDPVCKYGYFRGKQTQVYVKQVMGFYERFKREVPL